MIVPLPAVVHYRGIWLVRGDPLHCMFYFEWVLNVLGRFVADAHHRGILWRFPEKVVEKITRLGLEYLLEGSPYQVDTVQELIRTQVEYDWSSWDQMGYHLVRGVPVHLVGSKYLVQDLKSVEVIKIVEQDGGDCVEEVLAQGNVPVLRKTSQLGESGDQTGLLLSWRGSSPSPVGEIPGAVTGQKFDG
jgi:hypothetical protein